MNVLSVMEQPQVIPFKMQEVSPETVIKTVSNMNNGNLQKQIVQKVTSAQSSVPAVIKVISAGGGGGNALNRMIDAEFSGVEFISVNTDIQDLINKSRAEVKVQIGAKVTGGRGAGGIPDIGERAALEDVEALAEVLKGADMVFVTACLGGGTGTGSAHVIAKIAKEAGALTVGVVTMPFDFEGKYKMTLAENGLKKLREEVDTLIVIRSQNLLGIIKNTTTLDSAYLLADEILCEGVQGISEIITKTGYQNTDFADVKTIMHGKGDAIMGIGIASGENRALEAVENAIYNPLLVDSSIEGATGVLINIAGPDNITLVEVQNIIKTVKEKCDLNVHLIHGIRMDNNFDNSVQVTVIATGFQTAAAVEQIPAETEKPKKVELDSECNINEILNTYNKNLKRPDFLPQRELQNDLDIPPVIRNYGYRNDVKQDTGLTEF